MKGPYWVRTGAVGISPWVSDELVRSELFSVERLEQHGESLAKAQPIAGLGEAGLPIIWRVRDNYHLLRSVHEALLHANAAGQPLTPAAQWLVDNYHVVAAQIREIRGDLPPGYYRLLPKLASGPFAGYPRVLGIAWAFVAHTDSRFDADILRRFVQAYQRVQPLTIGELWAVAITLRIVLVENLRRAATRIIDNRDQRQAADEVANALLRAGGELKAALPQAIAHIPNGPLNPTFAVQLLKRLRDQGPDTTPALLWLEEQLAAQGTNADEIVQEVHQNQAAMSVTVRNVITSMRMVSTVDWNELFESVSLVDAALREGSEFAEMEFATRNMYRTAIEKLAQRSRLSELDVTREVLRAVWNHHQERRRNPVPGRATDGPPIGRGGDPGYYLIGDGRAAFEAAIGFRPPLRARLRRTVGQFGLGGYAGAIAGIGLAIGALTLQGLAARGVGGWELGLFALLCVFPAADAAVALVNAMITSCMTPAALPTLALRQGIPAELRTLVVVPTLLTGLSKIAEQIERLEIHYLASPEGEVYFALLTDWTDAAAEHVEGDQELLLAAAAGIERLNRHYPRDDGGNRFLLLHRRRLWNPAEGVWMGWERKRGKLHELNRLLRTAADTSFLVPADHPLVVPADVRYVITLDSDTQLPRDAVRRLIGKIAHPLNRPLLDPVSRRVVTGHGILQPRVTPSLPVGTQPSVLQYAFSATAGIDPYATVTSDVYQDLFDQGSYAGKGIYEVDIFEQALAGRVPENTMLSHDLFEGVFARAGLATDVEVIEEFPARYDVAISRQHRWARGDWQLLPWILYRSSLPPLGRWKMLDNLRRSLTAPMTVAGLFCGWWLNVDQAGFWTGFLLLTIALPALLPVLAGIVPRRGGGSLRGHFRELGTSLRLAGTQMALLVFLLGEQACQMGDAVVRTLARLFITRRRLLEWTTADQVQAGLSHDVIGHYRRMPGTVVLSVLTLAAASVSAPGVWALALPFAFLWLKAPAIAWWASRTPPGGDGPAAAPEDLRALRLIARRTWRFFETFVTAGENMLPPDNFQEDPKPVVAHRTSPTNIGLYLLSVAAARDFCWVGLTDAVERLEATLDTLDKLERYNGHFYNWYDTSDLRPLDPRYVSSVDSGNLAGHLIALANTCEAWITQPLQTAELVDGVADAAEIARQTLLPAQATAARQAGAEDLLRDLDELLLRLKVLRAGGGAGMDIQETLRQQAERIANAADNLGNVETHQWAAAISRTIDGHLRDAALLARGAARDDRQGQPAPDLSPSLAELIARPAGGCATSAARGLTGRLRTVAGRAREFAEAMEFGFLLDPERKLLSIGFRTSDGSRDPSCYDLLASEARLGSFWAIARGHAPASHWFRLGRAMASVGRGVALISWSGSMFEYLMPSLVMRAPTGSLLATTNRRIVRRQMTYATERGLPWGMSESAFNARDLEMTYQYSNFGIPGLALKRGLGDSAVIAPYATALAAMVDPTAATRNFERLTAAGGRGAYGYYEALDYTPERVPEGHDVAIVRTYMAHHQGMTIVAILNAVHGSSVRAHFHTEPRVQATELLLQERMPRGTAMPEAKPDEARRTTGDGVPDVAVSRRVTSPHGAVPATHILSNGRYSVMVTAAGSGYSRWHGRAITRWREDITEDGWGSFVFLRDVATDRVWSAGYQPSGARPDRYAAEFNEEHAEITRRDGVMVTTMEVLVSAEDDAEVRRVTLTNTGNRPMEIEVTSYMELVLAIPADDAAHPVFSKLFVQTEFIPETGTVLATRRRRSSTEPEMWAAHLVVVQGEPIGDLHVETDRAAFLGRGHGLRDAAAMAGGRPLSGSVGAVLDPIFSLRRRVRIAAGSSASLSFWTMAANGRQAVLEMADRHRDAAAFERAFTLAWTQAQVQLRHIAISRSDAARFQQLAGHVIYANALLRPAPDPTRGADGGPALLWALGISGDLPILVVRIDDVDDIDFVRQMLQAHEYWRMKRLAVDLVILNDKPASYNQDLQLALDAAVRMGQTRRIQADEAGHAGPMHGTVYELRADLLSRETLSLLLHVARVVLVSGRGTLADQIDRLDDQTEPAPPPARRPLQPKNPAMGETAWPVPDLEFFNGLGGFAADGREYVTVLRDGQTTPAPWTNVVANPDFGFQVTADGGGNCWWLNSRENQITPWPNDPVADRPGDVLYLRDEDSGAVWGPTALPIRLPTATYQVHDGMGYSRFRSAAYGIATDLLQFVPIDDPVKISRLTLRNTTDRTRRLSVTSYVEWVLGPLRAAGAPMIITARAPSGRAVLARNPWNTAFQPCVAFAAMPRNEVSVTGDRREFIGRNGTLAWPAALTRRQDLSNRVGAALDPCAALQTRLALQPGESIEIVVLLGAARTAERAQQLMARYADADLGETLNAVTSHWDAIVGAVQVTTPDRSMDIMLNGWLLYQTLACRIWARAGYYQASGAFGFRDQLQDGMALAAIRPDLTRAHLLRAAARQFPEGDVQHWWLPGTGQGVRTRISDDRVWLAYAAAQYLTVTGDLGALDEPIPFLQGPVLADHEHESYFLPEISATTASLFEHCALGLDHALATGRHGLPLIGTGDWNDGMSRVGEAGSGESIWMAWFLFATLQAFAPIAQERGETDRAEAWRAHAARLQKAAEQEGWDGSWYRRAYYDDGTPLGSVASSECRIDAIAQSWAVISGAADPARADRAMMAVDEQLVRRHDRLALLFTPPFDHTPLDPGYIKGYPPGIRENGGQYTHAGTWSVIALALRGDGDRAGELFAMLNPINHARTPADSYRYKVEPFVVAADIYSSPGHVGRGGWTWYTGSAGWMYRAGVEWVLGIRRRGQELWIDPCVPKSWKGFEVRLRHGGSLYDISVANPRAVSRGVTEARLDGVMVTEWPLRIPLHDDGATHTVDVTIG